MAKEVLTAVRRTSPFLIDVTELLRRPGSSRRVGFDARVDGASLTLARLEPGSDVHLDLHLDSLVDGVLARGTATAQAEVECRRCLRRIPTELAIEINDLFETTPQPDEEAFGVEDGSIDLEPAVRDAVVLALPINPLCREDCKGLCPRCGADRNETDCGHTEERTDARWEALQRLRERLEE